MSTNCATPTLEQCALWAVPNASFTNTAHPLPNALSGRNPDIFPPASCNASSHSRCRNICIPLPFFFPPSVTCLQYTTGFPFSQQKRLAGKLRNPLYGRTQRLFSLPPSALISPKLSSVFFRLPVGNQRDSWYTDKKEGDVCFLFLTGENLHLPPEKTGGDPGD